MAHDDAFFLWITRLVRTHRASLVAVARREGLHAEDALDAVQDAFTTFLVLPHAPRLAGEDEDSEKLLSVLVRNHARNRRRRHEVARPHTSDDAELQALEDDADSVEALVSRAEEHVRAAKCLDRLRELQRRVLTLRLLEDEPGVRVAELIGATPGNVAVILHRAKREMRDCLDEM